MKIKNEKTKLIIWALVALVIGVIIGMLINNFATTGNAFVVRKSANENEIKAICMCSAFDCGSCANASTSYAVACCKACACPIEPEDENANR
jgi:hypothetical protein